jgi:hypothetical protein
MENTMQRLLIAVALLTLTPLATAQVYKWTDAGGTVHYSQTPPEQGTNFKKVTTTGSVKPLAAPPAASNQTTSSTAVSTPAPQAPQAPVANTPENRDKLCDALKNNIAALQGTGPVVMNQDGKTVALDATQRQQQTDAAKAQQAQFCAKQ